MGDLTPTRDFNFVKDTCAGFIALAESPLTVGREINIATGTEISMQQTLDTIARLMDADVSWERDPTRIRPAGSEVFRLCGDNTAIKELTGWQPRYTLEEGLKATIDWFTRPENLAHYKTGIYNV